MSGSSNSELLDEEQQATHLQPLEVTNFAVTC